MALKEEQDWMIQYISEAVGSLWRALDNCRSDQEWASGIIDALRAVKELQIDLLERQALAND